MPSAAPDDLGASATFGPGVPQFTAEYRSELGTPGLGGRDPSAAVTAVSREVQA